MTMPGFQMSYTDPDTGATYPNAWIVVMNNVYGTPTADETATSCLVVYNVYANQAAFPSMRPVVEAAKVEVVQGGDAWTEYFEPSVMQQANHDLMTQAYAFLQSYLSEVSRKAKIKNAV